MKKLITSLMLLLFLWTGLASAQTISGSGSSVIDSGTDLPASCAVARLFFDTNATAGQNLYGCTATDTWTLQGAAGSFGETSLAELANNQVLWDGANASRTFTFSLSGATDPVLTFDNNSISSNVPITATLSGNASTATALAANGSNCSANSFPLGVDASGAVENCSTSISGNAATATALAADPTDCSANQFANAIAASGNLTCAQPAGDIEGVTAGKGLADGGASGTVTLNLKYSDTLAGNPALSAGECVFSTDGSGGGLICEGSTADTNEALLIFADPSADVTITVPAGTGTLAFQGSDFCTDAGSNDTYTCNLSPSPGAYTDNGHYRFIANTANTGAATINFNGIGAKAIVKLQGGVSTTLEDNDIRALQPVDLVYVQSADNFKMMSPLGNAAAGSGDIEGVTAGAGLGGGGTSGTVSLNTASGEADFLASGALTCGAGTQGKAQVHTTPLQYCDNAGTPALQYAAYADSSGNALAGDTATAFFSAGTIEAARLPSASDSASGISELATDAETTTGTDTGRAVTPDGLAGSDFGKRIFHVEVVADATALTTGDGKAYIPINAEYNGWVVVGVYAHVGAAVSSSGAVDLDITICGAVETGIRCSGTNRDLTSTNYTIDANEDGTETAAAAGAINTSNDDLATGEWIRFDVDGAGTGTQGLYAEVVLQKP